ncbi:hypothetical protein ANCCAN_04840 [Ancylostoma caninum]|uniref:Uncharacterized protein n=1 Tax=Ancylostoma caninum TaxID=29170 RepID=A0A368H1E5_ANCCA|nr:hypothetical protein ANCCAN_04840 [Ancylostoma caninum]
MNCENYKIFKNEAEITKLIHNGTKWPAFIRFYWTFINSKQLKRASQCRNRYRVHYGAPLCSFW